MRRKGMDGPDLRFLKIGQGGRRAANDLFRRKPVLSPHIGHAHPSRPGRPVIRFRLHERRQGFPEPLLHFRRGFVRKSERHDLHDVYRRRLPHEEVDEPVHEQGRLARAGSRRHHDILREGRLREAARLGIRYGRPVTHRVRRSWEPFVSATREAPARYRLDRLATRTAHDCVGRLFERRRCRNSGRARSETAQP